jgi:hypothetical protein
MKSVAGQLCRGRIWRTSEVRMRRSREASPTTREQVAKLWGAEEI